MGIKGLWTVLSPFSEKKSLHEIRGETIAVDLAGWVCDSQNVTDYHIQPKLYLRTIFLILADVNPVFVLEGDAPALKRDVMAARNAIQFRGAAPRSETVTNKQPGVGRKRFRNCETLLKSMGVICINGKGEAEATCAQLNSQGLVDAVVSQDSDCFAYGARRVYRNFSVSSAAGGGALQGSIECYDAEKMFLNNGFGRNKMVALALLCGCDYGIGACGSSITTYEERTRWSAAPGRCDRCGHVGRTHAKNGCPVCATHRGCQDNGHKLKVAAVKRELSLRKRALSCGVPFPEPKVMTEFLNVSAEKLDFDSLKKPPPSLVQFVNLMSSKLDWSERYSVQKFLPLLTKWHLQDNVPCRTIKPVKINKKRNPKGVPSYEVQWTDIDGQYEALISDDQFQDGEDITVAWTSIERQDLLQRYYPDIVNAYEETIKKPVREKKSRGRKNKDSEINEKPKRKYKRKVNKSTREEVVNLLSSAKNDLTNKTSELNTSKVHVKVIKLKRKLKKCSATKGQKTIHSFIANKRRKSSKQLHCLQSSFKNLSLETNENTKNMEPPNHLLSMFKSTIDNNHDSDLSDIVDGIVTRAPLIKTAKLDENFVKLVFNKNATPRKSVFRKSALIDLHYNSSTPRGSPLNKSYVKLDHDDSGGHLNQQVNTSYFFDKLTDDRDAFEISLDQIHTSKVLYDVCENTCDISLPNMIGEIREAASQGARANPAASSLRRRLSYIGSGPCKRSLPPLRRAAAPLRAATVRRATSRETLPPLRYSALGPRDGSLSRVPAQGGERGPEGEMAAPAAAS
ncbi:hypothetical protein MSG28_000421 [Choristoneura fumiferana]|uniref:Uncharacterized protein n=1 Tax=Choristoneura fumiferana TaxID=7141 RepID=A0ACC0K0P5_CHOFU|nr:hypothetical protein MSG28_000421 [Choristoneura fumiferana]